MTFDIHRYIDDPFLTPHIGGRKSTYEYAKRASEEYRKSLENAKKMKGKGRYVSKVKETSAKKRTKKTKNTLSEFEGGALDFIKPIFDSIGYWFKYGHSWKQDKKAQEAQLRQLQEMKKNRGGAINMEDLRDGLMGPIGWIRMGVRKTRQKKIDKLRNELGV